MSSLSPPRPLLAVLTSAAIKKTASLFRSFGGSSFHPDWEARASVCARCPIAHRHGKHLYCGKPLIHQPVRPPEAGCGCPIIAKAQDPAEHCPLTAQYLPTDLPTDTTSCPCQWCAAARAKSHEIRAA